MPPHYHAKSMGRHPARLGTELSVAGAFPGLFNGLSRRRVEGPRNGSRAAVGAFVARLRNQGQVSPTPRPTRPALTPSGCVHARVVSQSLPRPTELPALPPLPCLPAMTTGTMCYTYISPGCPPCLIPSKPPAHLTSSHHSSSAATYSYLLHHPFLH